MAAHSLAAAKRLRKELNVLTKQSCHNPKGGSSGSGGDTGKGGDHQLLQDDTIILQVDPNNILNWTAWLRGPDDTPYESGVFQLAIRCSTEYPLVPPSIKFVTKVSTFMPTNYWNTRLRLAKTILTLDYD